MWIRIPPLTNWLVGQYGLSTSNISTARTPTTQVPADDPLILIFTSGTTGIPKGAMFGERELAAVATIDTGGAWAEPGTADAGSSLKAAVPAIVSQEGQRLRIDEVLINTRVKNLDLVPSNIDLSAAEIQLVNEVGREQTLARQKQMGIVPAETELPPVNPIGTSDSRTGPDATGQTIPAAASAYRAYLMEMMFVQLKPSRARP